MRSARTLGLVSGALLALATALGLLIGRPHVAARGSVLSRGAGGWLAARLYLEERGVHVRLLDAPFEPHQPLETLLSAETPPGPHPAPLPERPGASAAPAVLVLAFPWQRIPTADTAAGLERHLRAGGTVVLAYSGEPSSWGEREMAGALGLGWREARGEPPLHPLRWREYRAEEWPLRREGARPDEPSARLTPPRRAPRPPDSARIWYRGPDGSALAFAYPRSGGRVVVLPADVLANARLGHAGNADALESLRLSLGGDWTFDEYHHGLSRSVGVEGARLRQGLDLYLMHVAIVYFLAVLALTRRFGPAWSEPAAISGSAGAFLLGLGALHHRLGHHAAAARRLVERAAELEPRLRLPAVRDASVTDGAGLLALSRVVGRAQATRGWAG